MLKCGKTSSHSSQIGADYPKSFGGLATFCTFASSNGWNSESKAEFIRTLPSRDRRRHSQRTELS